jgi:SpoVK/Ycf46/Vps4 family AAA+-type ATPase
MFIGNNPQMLQPNLNPNPQPNPNPNLNPNPQPNPNTNYDVWQNTHEVNIQEDVIPPSLTTIEEGIKLSDEQFIIIKDEEIAITLPCEETPLLPKEKFIIEDTIENVNDLLKILNKYVLDENIEYNIDLKRLNEIKPELEELNKMVGMEELKSSIIDQLFYFLQDLHLSNLGGDFKHTVIYGPPGTGKTEIAKIMGRMFSKIGVLKNNCFKKVVRDDLVAGYLGQTAIKTKKVINECLGGVLFIDEVYSLATNIDDIDSFSLECINTICEALSEHKDNLMVIIAGYENEVINTFFKANKGLESRFIWRFKINGYTSRELLQIYKKKVAEIEWSFESQTPALEKWFENQKEHFLHFGRDMEILVLYTKICHARRIYGKPPELRKIISMVDLENGLKMFSKNTTKKETVKFPHMYL